MKLDELHVLQRQSGAQRHGVAVAGADMGLRRAEEDTAATARRQYHDMRPEQVQSAVLEPPRQDAAAGPVIHDQIEHQIFDKELGTVLETLLIKCVEHRVASPVGGGTGALGQALAPLHGVPAERALVDQAILGA